MSAAASTSTIAAAIHLPMCRTGTAVISSGLTSDPTSSVSAVLDSYLANGSVDLGVRDRPIGNTPLVEDRLVLAIRHEHLQRVKHRLLELQILRQRDPVGRRAV